MDTHLWRILGGSARVFMIFIPIRIAWFIIFSFDQFWNALLWKRILQHDLTFAGFFLSLVIFYLAGMISETKAGTWIDKNIFGKIPLLKHFLVQFNPNVRGLLKKAKGALIARYQSEWRVAFLTVVHKTKEGCLGSVGYIGVPPIPQQLDQNSPVKVREIEENGVRRYKLIPRDVAVKQELSFGTTVPPDAYKDVVEITFGRFVIEAGLLPENGKTDQ